MYLNLILGFSAFSLSVLPSAKAADLELLRNTKEPKISVFKEKEAQHLLNKYNESDKKQVKSHFYDSVQHYLESENLKCEFRLVTKFEDLLRQSKLPTSSAEMQEYFKLLRSTNDIDSLLYELVTNIYKDKVALDLIDKSDAEVRGSSNQRTKLLSSNPLEENYMPFKTWPDEQSACIYQDFVHLKNITFDEDNKLSKKGSDFKYLNTHARHLELISSATYLKLEYLRKKSSINQRSFWLQDYFRVTFNAKDKMLPNRSTSSPVKLTQENSVITERIGKMTRRKLLYRKYDETQIIQLAQVLQKASRRMGVDADTVTKAPVITQEFEILLQDGSRETYVEAMELDPQSQYNLARRLMRKDILQLQMMDSFRKSKITYEDIIVAGFETGYISYEEIELVAKYDDLWNPKRTKLERMTNFIFRVAGYSTFFVPPPYNIVASVALGVTEGLVNEKFKTGAEHDNPSTFIE